VVFWLYLHFCFSRANGLLRCCPTGRERGDIASAPGGGQAAVGDVGEGNPRAIWRSLMRIRSAVGDEAGELAWVQIGAARRVTSAEIHRFIAAHTEAAS
jgi:hypothetical protein